MLNFDGVVLGNYCCFLMGFDLNCYWQELLLWVYFILVVCKNYLMQLDEDENVYFDFYIDIYVYFIMMNGFMYGNIYDEEE